MYAIFSAICSKCAPSSAESVLGPSRLPAMNPLVTLTRILARLIGARDLVILVLLALSVTFLEAVSVSAIIPAIAALVGDKSRFSLDAFVPAGFLSTYDFRQIALLALLGIFLLKGAFLAHITYKQSSIVFSKQKDLARKILSRYFSQSFEESDRVSTPELIRSLVSDLSSATHGVLLPFVGFTSEISLVIGAMLVVAIFDFYVGSALAVTIVVAGFAMVTLNKKRLSKWGIERHALEAKRVKFIQEAVAGLKEIKLYGLESTLVEKADSENSRYSQILTNSYFLQNTPRIFLETVGIVALCVTALLLLRHERSSSEVLILVSLIGAAAFRILPSLAKIISQIQSIRFFFPSLASIAKYIDAQGYEERGHAPRTRAERPRAIDSIWVQDLHYRYPTSPRSTLGGATLELRKGDVAALMGKTGAGKSTLVDCLIGIRTRQQGTILVDGGDLDLNLRDYQNSIAYVPQHPVILHDSIRENITLSRQIEGGEVDAGALDRALHCSGLSELLESLGLSLDDVVMEGGKSLSGGQRQRVALARAVYKGASFLVLDEATSAMDRESEREVITRIVHESRAAIILIITHRSEIIGMCNKVFDISAGKITISTPLRQQLPG